MWRRSIEASPKFERPHQIAFAANERKTRNVRRNADLHTQKHQLNKIQRARLPPTCRPHNIESRDCKTSQFGTTRRMSSQSETPTRRRLLALRPQWERPWRGRVGPRCLAQTNAAQWATPPRTLPWVPRARLSIVVKRFEKPLESPDPQSRAPINHQWTQYNWFYKFEPLKKFLYSAKSHSKFHACRWIFHSKIDSISCTYIKLINEINFYLTLAQEIENIFSFRYGIHFKKLH